MLESLGIHNFKNIHQLELEGLGNVNLFTGKNNTGKSTILEAIGLLVNNGDMHFILQLLENRGEPIIRRSSNPKTIYEKENIQALSSHI